MRTFLYILTIVGVVSLAFWAYRENYATQAALSETRDLRKEIRTTHERLSKLRAEWAYLNRPDRLRDLAELNFDRLGLLPLMPDAFGDVKDIIDPIPEILPITNPIDVSSVGPSTDEDPL